MKFSFGRYEFRPFTFLPALWLLIAPFIIPALLVLLVLLILPTSHAHAQDVELSPGVRDMLEPVAEQIIKAVVVFVYSLTGGKQSVQAITSLLKRYVFTNTSASTLAFMTSLGLAALIVIATQFGVREQLETSLSGLTTILSAIFGVHLLASGSAASYAKDKDNGVALFGAQRKE